MTEMTKPLAPGEIRTATRTDGWTVKIMHVSGGSRFYVEVRDTLGILAHCRNFQFEDTALRKFAEYASI